jgi:hypothetical protein
MYGTPNSYPKNNIITLCCDEGIGDGENHPWCYIDFSDDLMSEF